MDRLDRLGAAESATADDQQTSGATLTKEQLTEDALAHHRLQASPVASVTPGTRMGGRLEFLDFVRALAAIAVLVEHGGYHFVRGFAGFTHTLFSFGKFGITAFFLVSGFIIPLSLERRPGLKRFWILRFFRLYPLYWFSLSAALTLYLLGDHDLLTPEFLSHTVRNSVVNLTMVQGIAEIPHAIGLYYTLTIEMLFYVACTLLIVLNRLRDAYKISWLILSAATAIAVGAPLILHHRVEMAGLFYVVTLSLGAAVYRMYAGEVSRQAFAALLGGVLLFIVVGVWLNYVVNKKEDAFEHYSFLAVALPWVAGYALFLGLLALRQLNYPKPLLYLGRISYSIYLLHPLVLSLFRVREGDSENFLLFAATSLVLAALSFQLIEKPAYEFGQRLTKKPTRNQGLALIASR